MHKRTQSDAKLNGLLFFYFDSLYWASIEFSLISLFILNVVVCVFCLSINYLIYWSFFSTFLDDWSSLPITHSVLSCKAFRAINRTTKQSSERYECIQPILCFIRAPLLCFERRFCYFDIEDFCLDAIRLIISAIDIVVVGHAFHVTQFFFTSFCFIIANHLSTNLPTLFFC